jgi:hypothetical protein
MTASAQPALDANQAAAGIARPAKEAARRRRSQNQETSLGHVADYRRKFIVASKMRLFDFTSWSNVSSWRR